MALVDPRIVYSAGCSWWGAIHEVGHQAHAGPVHAPAQQGPPGGLPCCPHCGSVLFELPDEQTWWSAVEESGRLRGDPRYREFMEWLRHKPCWPSLQVARTAFERSTDGRN